MSLLTTCFLVLLIAAPGLGLTLLMYGPGEIPLVRRLTLVVALGLAVDGGIAFLLALVGLLRPVSVLAAIAVATVVMWALAFRRASPRDHVRSLIADLRAEPWTLAATGAVVLAIAVVRGLDIQAFPPAPTSFHYWGDAADIANSGRLPSLSIQYGALYPKTISKVVLDSFNAGVDLVVGDPLRSMGSLLWIGSVGFALALVAVGRELGLRMTAVLAPLLLMTNQVFLNTEMTSDLNAYRAELFGRMLAFTALAVALGAVREGHRRDQVLAGGLFAAAALSHLIPTVVAVAMLGWYVLATLLRPGDRTRRKTLEAAIIIPVVAGALAGGILLVSPGQVGFEGAASPALYAEVSPDLDPTAFFHTGHVRPLPPLGHHWWVPPASVFDQYAAESLGIDLEDAEGARGILLPLLPIGGVLFAAVALWAFPSELRRIGVVALGLALTLVGGALWFSWRDGVAILGTFGIRRLFDYGSIPFILIGLALVELVLWSVGRVATWARNALILGLVAAAIVLLVPSAGTEDREDAGAARESVAILNWIRGNVPCDALLLSNQASTGVYRVMAGRVGLMEGMAPYLRPDVLREVIPFMLDVQRFFRAPASGAAFLREEGVDYVVYARDLPLGRRSPIGDVAARKLRAVPFLQKMFETDRAAVYQVVGLTPDDVEPGLVDQPTLRCRRGPVAE